MFELGPQPLTDLRKLKTDVEHKTTYALDRCELNIFETHKKAEKVKLRFDGFTITSMLRGKKVIHTNDAPFHYLPGQTLMVPSTENMLIDFPEANFHSPSQCTALVIDNSYLHKQLEYINDSFPRDREYGMEWKLNPDAFFLQNDEQIAVLGNKLIRLFSGSDPLREILIDLKLKELLLSILRLQNFCALNVSGQNQVVSDRFLAVVEYIRRNASGEIQIQALSKMACMSKSSFYRTFTNEFGISPNKMIILEKLRLAKSMLASDAVAIKDVCFAAGFSDPNYFSRIFRKMEGITPGEYRKKMLGDI